MIEQEAKDLAAMKVEMAQKKEALYSYLLMLDRATPDELLRYGYRNMSNAEAMREGFKSYHKQILKLTTDHVRKYPD